MDLYHFGRFSFYRLFCRLFFLLLAIFLGDALNNNENIMRDISEHWLITV